MQRLTVVLQHVICRRPLVTTLNGLLVCGNDWVAPNLLTESLSTSKVVRKQKYAV